MGYYRVRGVVSPMIDRFNANWQESHPDITRVKNADESGPTTFSPLNRMVVVEVSLPLSD
jgi:hypothetical protein